MVQIGRISLRATVLAALLSTIPALCQNTVTTPEGTINQIPIFSSSTSIVNSGLWTNGPGTGLNFGCSTNPAQLTGDQGGSISLGGRPSQVSCTTGQTPYIDFHFGSGRADVYNFRLVNSADGRLDFNNLSGNALSVVGLNLGIGQTAPTERLDVVGNAKIEGTGSGIIFPDGTKQTSAGITSNYTGNLTITGTVTATHVNSADLTMAISGRIRRHSICAE